MSMISPQSFIEFECKGKSYKELLEIRDELLQGIYDYENRRIAPEEYRRLPSPETVYQMDLLYLGELCKLISDTYSEELWQRDEKDSEDGISGLIDLMIRVLKAEPDGYCTTTNRLLRDAGLDTDVFDDADLTRINSGLFEAAEKEGLILDMSAHEGKLEGLPYNLDFIVRKK